MNSKTRLVLSVVSATLVLLMIFLGATSVFGQKRYIKNTDVEIINDVSDLSLQIVGAVNGVQGFDAVAQNGTINNTSWPISEQDTTFTKNRRQIIIEFMFFNRSNASLKITISGILIDPQARFSTAATDGNGVGIDIVNNNNLGTLETVLEGGMNKSKTVKLIYTLEKTNFSINNEPQSLKVSISLAG
jgi:hypothetical protein